MRRYSTDILGGATRRPDRFSQTSHSSQDSLILSSYCGYFNIEEKLYSVLFVSWVTEDYYKKHVDGRWTKIESFDDNFIKVFLSKES